MSAWPRRWPWPAKSRSFPTLRDAATWSTLVETVALFNAAALVTGDGAIGLHVGERLLSRPTAPSSPNGSGGPRLPRGSLQARRTAGRALRDQVPRRHRSKSPRTTPLIQVSPARCQPPRPSVRDDPRAAVPGLCALRPRARPDQRDRVQRPGWAFLPLRPQLGGPVRVPRWWEPDRAFLSERGLRGRRRTTDLDVAGGETRPRPDRARPPAVDQRPAPEERPAPRYGRRWRDPGPIA